MLKTLTVIFVTVSIPGFLLILPYIPVSGENIGFGYGLIAMVPIPPLTLAFMRISIRTRLLSLTLTAVLIWAAGIMSYPDSILELGFGGYTFSTMKEFVAPYLGLFVVGIGLKYLINATVAKLQKGKFDKLA